MSRRKNFSDWFIIWEQEREKLSAMMHPGLEVHCQTSLVCIAYILPLFSNKCWMRGQQSTTGIMHFKRFLCRSEARWLVNPGPPSVNSVWLIASCSFRCKDCCRSYHFKKKCENEDQGSAQDALHFLRMRFSYILRLGMRNCDLWSNTYNYAIFNWTRYLKSLVCYTCAITNDNVSRWDERILYPKLRI